MNKALALVAALAIMSLSAAADAAVTLNSVRIVAKNAEALGKFYAAAFGLKETNRLQTQGGPELFLNFGDTVDAARANSAAAAKAAGGTVEREATQFGTTGIYIAFVVDPESNHIELIQQPAR
jgi:predicted enzyme related to lactoylglutathione lyase